MEISDSGIIQDSTLSHGELQLKPKKKSVSNPHSQTDVSSVKCLTKGPQPVNPPMKAWRGNTILRSSKKVTLQSGKQVEQHRKKISEDQQPVKQAVLPLTKQPTASSEQQSESTSVQQSPSLVIQQSVNEPLNQVVSQPVQLDQQSVSQIVMQPLWYQPVPFQSGQQASALYQPVQPSFLPPLMVQSSPQSVLSQQLQQPAQQAVKIIPVQYPTQSMAVQQPFHLIQQSYQSIVSQQPVQLMTIQQSNQQVQSVQQSFQQSIKQPIPQPTQQPIPQPIPKPMEYSQVYLLPSTSLQTGLSQAPQETRQPSQNITNVRRQVLNPGLGYHSSTPVYGNQPIYIITVPQTPDSQGVLNTVPVYQ